MRIRRFLYFLHFINNFSETPATFLVLLIFHLLFYHNHFGIKNIKIKVNPFTFFFLYDLFNINNEFKAWAEIKISYKINSKFYFTWRQIVNSIPKTWQKVVKESQSDSSNLGLLYHQLLKNNRTVGIDKKKSSL